MKKSAIRFALLAFASLHLASSSFACGDDAAGGADGGLETGEKDAGPPSDAGVAGDAGGDLDTGPDGGSDVGSDGGADAAADSGPDASWPPRAPDPPVGRELKGISFGDGWTDPRELPFPVSTEGWEDSSIITADGTTLYFAYSRYDAEALMQGRVVTSGPDRPGQKGPAFDIYEASFPGGQWVVANSVVNDPNPDLHEAAVGINRDQGVMAFVRFDSGGDIYLSRKAYGEWGTPEKLPVPVNTPCVEDNPHLSPDALAIYFDSNRADAQGSSCLDEKNGLARTFYVSRFKDGGWSAPEPLKGSPNETQVRWQVFITDDGTEAYWTGVDPDCPQSCIFLAMRQPDGSYAGRDTIAKAKGYDGAPGEVGGLGEVSLTADGRYMYFVFVERTAENKLQVSLGVARR